MYSTRAFARQASAAIVALLFFAEPPAAKAQAALTAFWMPAVGEEVVVYAAYGGGLNVLYHTSNGWFEFGLTEAYALGSPLTSYNSVAYFECIRNPDSPSEIVDICAMSNLGYPDGGSLTDVTTTLNASENPGAYAAPYSSSVSSSTQLTGFVDSSGTAHLFYVGNSSGYVHEMYGDNGVPVQYDHTIGTPQVTNGTTLNSLWDGSVEHVYYITNNQFWETYYNGNWWSYSHSGQDIPEYTIVSAFVGGNQGLLGPSSAPAGDITTWTFNPSGGDRCYYPPENEGWCFAGAFAASIAANPESNTPIINFTDNDRNFLFYVVPGSPNVVTDGQMIEWSGVTDSSIAPVKQIAGFFDGTNHHVFWVGTDSNIHEAYGSNQNPSTWTVHAITSDGSAQN